MSIATSRPRTRPARRSPLALGDANPLVPYLYLLPFTLFFLAFVVYPILSGVWISLHRFDPLQDAQPYVGLQYYRDLFDPASAAGPIFWQTMRNTLFFVAVSVPLLVGLALLLAVQLHRPVPLRALWRSVFFMPGILSVSVMGILWRWMFENGVGLINVIRDQVFHLPSVAFITTEGLAWVPIVVGTVWWTVGFNMTLYLAALGNISQSLYEAADLDGATGWEKFRNITWPLLAPTTLLVTVTTVLGSFQLFGQSQLITGGGPSRSTESVIGFITEQAFTNNQFSSAVAMAFVLGLVMLLFTAAQFRIMTAGERSAPERARRPARLAAPGWLGSWSARREQRRYARALAGAARRHARPPRPQGRAWATLGRTALLLAQALLFLAPLYWMLSTSFKPESDTIAAPVQWVPARPTFENYANILTSPDGNMLRWAFNSLVAALGSTAVHLVICVLAAYALARMTFRGRDAWFWTVLSSLMVPGIVTLIPTYVMMLRLNWIDTYHALLWPGVAGAFGVFLLRQFFLGIPRELEEAARMDGASSLQVLRHVILPLSMPALVTLGVLAFMASWNNYIWPLFVVHGDMQTLPVGITQFTSRYVNEYGKLMAGTAVAGVPLLIAYLFAQRFFEQGIAVTGLKE
ncbi:hypothetical protein DAETH_38860 (plasmid) [Deinococcus aetherius]|uniref:ABC transmembrane type-1 domain-containing protein n=1 Tax=Deinococcus aetherius TaxID=200252 RepID=A0ABM8AJB8_9DEIO|nr:ABC transporter permease subunit [Deinococcus aetherius]BDP43917.1 hypothetical protein DAETH_38860 [Deinococcus aetherius]